MGESRGGSIVRRRSTLSDGLLRGERWGRSIAALSHDKTGATHGDAYIDRKHLATTCDAKRKEKDPL